MPFSDQAHETSHAGETFQSGSTKSTLAITTDYVMERTTRGPLDDGSDWEWWSSTIKEAVSMLDSDIVDVFKGNVTRAEAVKDKTDKKQYERSANQLYMLMSTALGKDMKTFEDLEGEEIYPELEMHCRGV
ncbi:hypothetical protein JCM5296_007335 [Sporobolomyces johnsonii]